MPELKPVARPAPRVVLKPEALQPGNTYYGVATLALLAAAIGLVFLPWVELILFRNRSAAGANRIGEVAHTYNELELVVVKVSPVSFVMNIGRLGDAVSGSNAASQGAGIADLMLAASPFVYAVGLIVAIVGAFQILSSWRSIAATVGFALSLIGCLLAVIGILMLASAGPGPMELRAERGIIRLMLTPWFYAAMLVGFLGFATSVFAITRRRRAGQK